MKKVFGAAFLILFALYSCKPKLNKDIEGVWQVTQVAINGTEMDGSVFGKWMWEFNGSGGYRINLSGAVDTGRYDIRDKVIVLRPSGPLKKPETQYKIVSLDSLHLKLDAVAENNKTSLDLLKVRL